MTLGGKTRQSTAPGATFRAKCAKIWARRRKIQPGVRGKRSKTNTYPPHERQTPALPLARPSPRRTTSPPPADSARARRGCGGEQKSQRAEREKVPKSQRAPARVQSASPHSARPPSKLPPPRPTEVEAAENTSPADHPHARPSRRFGIDHELRHTPRH